MTGSAIDKETGAGDNEGLEKSHSRESKPNSDAETSSSFSYSEQMDIPEEPSSRAISRTVSEVWDGIESRRDLDLEQGQPEEKTGTAAIASDPNDPNLVTWAGPEDPENPKNWTFSKKWGAVFIVSLFTLVSPVSSSMVAPSLNAIGEELNITEAFERNIVLSIFVLAYALGPLV
ncbi:hypothetical protein M434DRAFT_329656 [Hypoxylon sp. CO27-5]|nr:hypothetical protein M434DRAFT_329656 [Hypoxylon sp. CO27-5]